AGAAFSKTAVNIVIVHDKNVDRIRCLPGDLSCWSGATFCGCASDDSIAIVIAERPRVGRRYALVGCKMRRVVVNDRRRDLLRLAGSRPRLSAACVHSRLLASPLRGPRLLGSRRYAKIPCMNHSPSSTP